VKRTKVISRSVGVPTTPLEDAASAAATRGTDELLKRTRSVLRAIQRSPDRIEDYFKLELVCFAV
jgi:hypothetical protein